MTQKTTYFTARKLSDNTITDMKFSCRWSRAMKKWRKLPQEFRAAHRLVLKHVPTQTEHVVTEGR